MTSQPLSQRLEAALGRGLINLPPALLRMIAGQPLVLDEQTLDGQCQFLLRLLRMRGVSLGGGDMSVAKARKQVEEQSGTFAPEAKGKMKVEAIRVAGGDGTLDARVYRPGDCPSPAPATIFYHGGGFVLGSLDSHDGICRALAERARCVVIAVDYRLAPEHKAPAAAEDALAAFRDIAARASELGLDAPRIALCGDSAGGNLAAVVAQQACHDARPPRFQLLFYPVTDFAEDRPSKDTFAQGLFLEKASMDWFEAHYLPDGLDLHDARISPLYGDLGQVAPALVVTGGFDPLRDEGEAYARKLKAAGVATTLRREASLIHGFLSFARGVERADVALSQAAADLAKALDTDV